jgi:low temperature requirement protein LtrA
MSGALLRRVIAPNLVGLLANGGPQLPTSRHEHGGRCRAYAPPDRGDARGETVTPLELFFDLVFVLVPAAALLGGTAMYLLAHVAFRFRHIRTLNTRRLGLSVLLVAFIPVAVQIPALATLTVLAVALALLIVIETRSYGDARDRMRHELRHEGGS